MVPQVPVTEVTSTAISSLNLQHSNMPSSAREAVTVRRAKRARGLRIFAASHLEETVNCLVILSHHKNITVISTNHPKYG